MTLRSIFALMKSLICLLLSLYVLTLSVLPCADGGLQLRSDKAPVSVSADSHDHTQDAPCDDHCSPLCVCTCCGTVADQPPIFSFALPQLDPAPVVDYGVTRISTALLSVFLPTWQPPQLA